MNELQVLLEKVWISKEEDKEQYYQVKRKIPLFQGLVQKQLGWRLIHTEKLIKIEKTRPEPSSLWVSPRLAT